MKKISFKIVLLNIGSMVLLGGVLFSFFIMTQINIRTQMLNQLDRITMRDTSIGDAAKNEAVDKIEGIVSSSMITSALITVALIIVIAFISYIIGKRMAKPISTMNELLVKVQDGDLNVQMSSKGNDEISSLAKGFNQMIENLQIMTKDIIGLSDKLTSSFVEIEGIAKDVATGSEETAKTVGDLSQGVAQQAEASEAANEMISNIVLQLNIMNESMEEARNKARSSMSTVDKGKENMNLQKQKMSDNQEASLKAASAITELSLVAQEIESIVDVIESISSQTNLLALNAAIEAARAGEAGKGFAVVADEIRKLAEQTIGSTKQISFIVTNISNSVNVAVTQIDVANTSVEAQSIALEESILSFEDISDSVKIIINNIEASADSTQQVNTAAQVASDEMVSVARIAEMSAASTEEVAATIEEQTSQINMVNDYILGVSELVSSLNDSVKRFKV